MTREDEINQEIEEVVKRMERMNDDHFDEYESFEIQMDLMRGEIDELVSEKERLLK